MLSALLARACPRPCTRAALPTSIRMASSTAAAPELKRQKTDDNPHKDGSTKWSSKDGHFRRQESAFRDAIATDGSSKFTPELNRYHLVAGMACPWAHRTMIVRRLKGIDKVPGLLPLTTVNSLLGKRGWSFVPYDEPELKGLGIQGTGNTIPGHEDKKTIRDMYLTADPEYTARCTVPIIWDNKLNTIVSNESSEIIRFLNTCFDEFIDEKYRNLTFYPQDDAKLKEEIDGLNDWIYTTINNGVYKCGFATTQDAYNEAVKPLFEHLDKVEQILSDGRRYLTGNERLTEADIRLFTTIVRFDPVYVGHFKCNVRTIRSGYPRIHDWLRHLYWDSQYEGAFSETTDFESIKLHYYQSHVDINPNRIVPLGPLPHILPLGQ